LSHSGDIALIAVTRDCEVGVDIERIRPDVVSDKLSERVFSELELAHLNAVYNSLRVAEFFWLWARKEALVKCKGTGLSEKLTELAVLGAVPSFTLVDLYPERGYCGALAVASTETKTVLWDFVAERLQRERLTR